MKKVLVAMSGGVDSSTAALLLKQQGYEVAGATFELFDGCPENNVEDARAVCEHLGITHHVLDYRALFSDEVIGRFIGAYESGQTPNPCVFCNRAIKFGAFLQDADRLGYDYISTGHYARVQFDEVAGRYELLRSSFLKKDQSYVLYHLSQMQLSRLLLPLDRYSKDETRALAREAGLQIAQRPDSQDICFVSDGDYAGFIERQTGRVSQPGNYIDTEGNILGQHRGVLHYTIGQRRGLGIALGTKMTVSALDSVHNTVTLADDSAVFSDTLFAKDLRLIAYDGLTEPIACTAKIRYAHTPAPATIYPLGNGEVRVQFETAQRAATPGQAVVFYDGERVVGGATIQ